MKTKTSHIKRLLAAMLLALMTVLGGCVEEGLGGEADNGDDVEESEDGLGLGAEGDAEGELQLGGEEGEDDEED